MLKSITGIVGVVILLGGVLVAKEFSESAGPSLTLRDIPSACRSMIQEYAKGNKVQAVFKEEEGGVVMYEAEWLVDGMKNEAVVMENGTLVETEKLIPATIVPRDIRMKAAKYFPSGTTIEYEEKLVVHYEAEAVVDGKKIEVLMTATGKIVEAPALKHADDDDDDDDDERR